MVFPLDIHIGSFTMSIHLVFDIIAFVVAIFYYIQFRAKTKDSISLIHRLDLIIGGIIGALIGSRLLASLEDIQYTLSNLSFLVVFSQQSIVGGIIGGIIGVEMLKKIKGIKIATGDLYVFPLILGIMIGRIGCFLTGVSDRTVGLPCSLSWCFNQGDGIPRHPTSLYEILFLGFLWVFLYWISKQFTFKEGVFFRLFVILYAIYRLIIEFLKPHGTLFFGLSSIQIGCLIALVYLSLQLIHKYQENKLIIQIL